MQQAWVAGHVTLALAACMMAEGLPSVNSVRGAASLMQNIINTAHRRLIEVRCAVQP